MKLKELIRDEEIQMIHKTHDTLCHDNGQRELIPLRHMMLTQYFLCAFDFAHGVCNSEIDEDEAPVIIIYPISKRRVIRNKCTYILKQRTNLFMLIFLCHVIIIVKRLYAIPYFIVISSNT